MAADCAACRGEMQTLVRVLRNADELNDPQRRMLRFVVLHGDAFHHLSGRSARGGGFRTHSKLTQLGFIAGGKITAAGMAAFTRIQAKATP